MVSDDNFNLVVDSLKEIWSTLYLYELSPEAKVEHIKRLITTRFKDWEYVKSSDHKIKYPVFARPHNNPKQTYEGDGQAPGNSYE